VLSRRHQPVHAHAKRHQIAAFGEIDRFARERLAIVLQQLLQQDRYPVARPARPAGGISAFAFLKLHGLSPFLAANEYAARGAACVRATKSPARSPAPASRRSFGEYAFLEDSRYASQAENVRRKRGVIIVLSQLRFCPCSASLPGLIRQSILFAESPCEE
jgi:hypothetical protein